MNFFDDLVGFENPCIPIFQCFDAGFVKFFVHGGTTDRVTQTGPVLSLVWAPRKGPENERKTIHNRNQNTHPTGSAEQ